METKAPAGYTLLSQPVAIIVEAHANGYTAKLRNPGDAALVTAMIDEHHRVRPARNPHPLVEAMRRADATDVYRLPLPPRVSRDDYRAMLKRFPDNGMHLMLGRGFVMGLKERKRLNPMPVVKL